MNRIDDECKFCILLHIEAINQRGLGCVHLLDPINPAYALFHFAFTSGSSVMISEKNGSMIGTKNQVS